VIEIKNGRRPGVSRGDEDGTTVTITVKGGELTVSRFRLPGRSWSVATVDGQIAEHDEDAILLRTARILKPNDCLTVELSPSGEA